MRTKRGNPVFTESGRRGASRRWSNHAPTNVHLGGLGLTDAQKLEARRLVHAYADRVRGTTIVRLSRSEMTQWAPPVWVTVEGSKGFSWDDRRLTEAWVREWLDLPRLSIRLFHLMTRYGFTVADARGASDDTLLAVRHLGPGTLRELHDALAEQQEIA